MFAKQRAKTGKERKMDSISVDFLTDEIEPVMDTLFQSLRENLDEKPAGKWWVRANLKHAEECLNKACNHSREGQPEE